MKKRYFLFVVLFAIALISIIYVWHFEPYSLVKLSYYALNSLTRMFIAFTLSVVFAVSFGYYAGTQKWGEKILIPLFDLLQSVPTLGLFPVVIILFITLFNGSRIGIEFAAIFLIWMCMVWNLIFAVYESIKSIPNEVRHAVESTGLKGWMKYRTLYLPSTVPALVYNSILSWGNGWYFLLASELISLGSATYRLPGLGAFFVDSAAKGDYASLFLSMFILAVIIFLMNTLIWKPLSVWAARFKYESYSESTEYTVLDSLAGDFTVFRTFLKKLNAAINWLFSTADKTACQIYLYTSKKFGDVKIFSKTMRAIVIATAVVFSIVFFYILLRALLILPPGVEKIPFAIFITFLRLLVAFAISCIWAVPAAVYLASNKKAEKILLPLFELTASLPATAFFPLVVAFVVSITSSFEPAAIILLVTGMQWYLFFNVYGGAKSIPSDLKQAAKSFGLKGKLYYTKLVLPAILPSFVTGAITAIGGGWNAVVVAEFISFGSNTYQVNGIGALIVQSLQKTGDVHFLVLSLTAMVITIFTLNRLVWDRLYNYVTTKFRVDY